MKDMYNSIPDDLTNDELTIVVHYAIKILNKYKSKENRNVSFDKLPFKDSNEKLDVICNNLLNEISVENLREKDIQLDYHINKLYKLLSDRLKPETDKIKQTGGDLLKIFGNEL